MICKLIIAKNSNSSWRETIGATSRFLHLKLDRLQSVVKKKNIYSKLRLCNLSLVLLLWCFPV